MMKKLLLCFTCLSFSFIYTQKIEINGNRFQRNGADITSMKQLEEIVSANPEALAYVKKARANKTASDIFGFIGGFGIGYTIGSLFGENKTYTPGLVGLGFIGLSIPFVSGANKNAKKSIETYNAGLTTTADAKKFNPEFTIINNQNGLGLSMRF